MNWLFVGLLLSYTGTVHVVKQNTAENAFLNLIPKHFVVPSNFALGMDM